jgi:transcriptional regulator with XRE-family HTH domain
VAVPDRLSPDSRKSRRTLSGRRAAEIRRALGTEILRQRTDSGLSQRTLAAAAGIDHGFLALLEQGEREPSISVLAALAQALGGDLSVRLYPGTGTRIHDAVQARILEELLAILHPRWRRFLEVSVYRPSRGVIDLVAVDSSQSEHAIAAEVESALRRLEQQIRWANEKAVALPSADIWQLDGPPSRVDRLLLVRSTRASRAVATRFHETLATAYPAPAAAAFASLTSADAPWPGSAILWATLDGDRVRILDRAPRGVPLV